jgi:ribose/xylose/arabinose/galactoside ABC-type transport system permease subunit
MDREGIAVTAGRRGERLRASLRQSVMEIVLLALSLLLALRAPGFLTQDNLLNVLRSVSMQGIIAFGMTMVIIAGEIDLSVGSAVAFSGCLAAWLTGWLAVPPFRLEMAAAVSLACLGSLLAGTFIGCLTGFLRVRFRVPTFIATLAWLTMLRGAAELITNGFPLTPFPDWFNFLGGGYLQGIPFPALVFIAVFGVIHVVMRYTAFGRAVYAVGGNLEAARLSGIRVDRVKVKVLGIVGFLAALSGIMQSSQIMSGSATTAPGWELDVISAVIIGGTSLMGGAGTVRGTLIGVIFLGVLVNGMTLMNISEYWQNVVRGGLILTAVLINMASSRRRPI